MYQLVCKFLICDTGIVHAIDKWQIFKRRLNITALSFEGTRSTECAASAAGTSPGRRATPAQGA